MYIMQQSSYFAQMQNATFCIHVNCISNVVALSHTSCPLQKCLDSDSFSPSCCRILYYNYSVIFSRYCSVEDGLVLDEISPHTGRGPT